MFGTRVSGTAISLATLLLIFGTSFVHADSRFNNGDGGALGGNGSLGQGSVTVHHNLLPEERTEIDNVIDTQRSELNNEIASLRALITKMQKDHAAAQASLMGKLANTENRLNNKIKNNKVDASELKPVIFTGSNI